MNLYSISELEELWFRFLSETDHNETVEIEDFFYYLYELENRDSDQNIIPGES